MIERKAPFIKGSLEPGKLADMVMLGDNPLTADPVKRKDIPVLATLVGNEVVTGQYSKLHTPDG